MSIEFTIGLSLIVGGIIGLFAGRFGLSNRREMQRLRTALEEAEKNAEQYQEQVTQHFSHTAELFNGMTKQYREVYQHLAEGAEALCPDAQHQLQEVSQLSATTTAIPAAPFVDTETSMREVEQDEPSEQNEASEVFTAAEEEDTTPSSYLP